MTRQDSAHIIMDEAFRLFGANVFQITTCTEGSDCPSCVQSRKENERYTTIIRKAKEAYESPETDGDQDDTLDYYLDLSDDLVGQAVGVLGSEFSPY